MKNYDDIINLPHHVSSYHRRLPIESRAAQFAPFAALTGHNAAISETARLTEGMKELSEEETAGLSGKLAFAMEYHHKIRITYFIPDKLKSGGTYSRLISIVKKHDEIRHTILMESGHLIPICFITDIEILDKSV